MSQKNIADETTQKNNENNSSVPLNPNYKAIIRVKPTETTTKSIEITPNTIILKEKPLQSNNQSSPSNNPSKEKEETIYKFGFNSVLDQNSSQEAIFKIVCEHSLNKLIEGQNSCIIGYGQTNSGKTFTIFGEDEHFSTKINNLMDMRKDKKGIVSRSLEFLLRKAKDVEESREYVMTASFYELYLDQIRDLGKAMIDKHNSRTSSFFYLKIFNVMK